MNARWEGGGQGGRGEEMETRRGGRRREGSAECCICWLGEHWQLGRRGTGSAHAPSEYLLTAICRACLDDVHCFSALLSALRGAKVHAQCTQGVQGRTHGTRANLLRRIPGHFLDMFGQVPRPTCRFPAFSHVPLASSAQKSPKGLGGPSFCTFELGLEELLLLSSALM